MTIDDKLQDICKWLREHKGITQIDLSDLIDLIPEYEEYLSSNEKEWTSDLVRCDLCGHGWRAVYHMLTKKLECPNCKNMTFVDIIT